jgi:hypothetical protein
MVRKSSFLQAYNEGSTNLMAEINEGNFNTVNSIQSYELNIEKQHI